MFWIMQNCGYAESKAFFRKKLKEIEENAVMQKKELQIKTYIVDEDEKYIVPESFLFNEDIRYIKVNECYFKKQNPDAYGNLKGIYKIWKHAKDNYICINWKNIISKVTKEQVEELQKGNIKMILPRVYCINRLQESYRAQYYGFDFRIMLSVLKKYYLSYYEHAKENVLDRTELFLFGGIFEKRKFDKICAWIFTVLEKCVQYIPKHFSKSQTPFLEHLTPYLFTIYVTYHEEKYSYELSQVEKLEKCENGKEEKEFENLKESSRQEIISYIDKMMEDRQPEKVVEILRLLEKERNDFKDIIELFEMYERERRYYKQTQLDKVNNWKELLGKKEEKLSPGILNGRPRLLIFQWNSIGHKVNVQAFESFGFECHTIQVPYDRGKFDEDCLEQLNRHLDFNQFDLAFSLNCIGMVAEACYTHNIPYIAWCYDSPSFTGAHWYLKYPTTHVFLFDSDDARHYKEAGIEQAHYMPLAVNVKYFEGLTYSQADKRKYQAEISFVGSLYDTNLPQGMAYLTDYQKGYLNALMDNQLDVYGHSFFPEVLSQKFMEWLDHPEFNRILNAEFDKEKAKEDVVAAGRLQLILNKQTTNKERLLLLNLLAKYHEVKLYSYKNSEALKGLTFCGTADYYTEMPKIFRYSKININATLRSIQNGIPLRCLDIMGCHGLLLTNYQKDFDDHFTDGKNVLFYTDAEEALEKADFYLSHDFLREKIAEAGFETVKKYYNYPVKIKEIMELAGLEHLIPIKGRD